MKHLTFIFMVLLVGCGSSNESAPKSVFSDWSASDSSLSLKGGSFTSSFKLSIDECEYDAAADGKESIGEITVSNGVYTGAGTDPGCSTLDGETFDFVKPGNVLNFCINSDCDLYN